MNIFNEFEDIVKQNVSNIIAHQQAPDDLPIDAITVQPPRDPSHGDMATNGAMVMAKPLGVKPRDLADKLVTALSGHKDIAAAEVAGPGFINMTLKPEFWQNVVTDILRQGGDYGRSQLGAGQSVNVEYVSANPTGPMHVGHCRGAIFGDALANVLEAAGYTVCREYYINDAGGQIDVLARSAFLRYQEALGQDIGDIPEGLYPGTYLVPVGEALASQHGDSLLTQDESDWMPVVKAYSVEAMMATIRSDLADLGIHHDVFFSEKALHTNGGINRAIKNLESQGLVYRGVLEPPKGKKPEDWEERPQLLFKATAFGDDTDRPLQKSDGTWTYFAADIAYHYDKFTRGYPELINIWGADHGGYIKRVDAAVRAMSEGKAKLDVKTIQLVNLFKNGEPFKMSKRAGTFVTLNDVVAEVGRDVTRFIMLTRKNNDSLDFDFAQVLEQSKDNPVFYVQYAHARAKSVLRAEKAENPCLFDQSADVSLLNRAEELSLIKVLAAWPRMVEQAAAAHEPHRIAFYLGDLAAAVHQFWAQGKQDPSLRFRLSDDAALTRARMALVEAVAIVIANGLHIMGVTPLDEM